MVSILQTPPCSPHVWEHSGPPHLLSIAPVLGQRRRSRNEGRATFLAQMSRTGDFKLSNYSSLPVGCSNSSDTARAHCVLLLTCHQSLRLLHRDPLTHQPLGSQEDSGLSCLHISECVPHPLPLDILLFTFKGPAAMLSSAVGCTKPPLLPSPRYILFLTPEPVMLPDVMEDMTELGSE